MQKRVVYDCPLGMECEKEDTIAEEKVTRRCAWYTRLRGQNPQDGTETEQWGCAMAMIPVLQIETSNMVRGVQAATESLRNENAVAGVAVHEGLSMLARAIQPAMVLAREGKTVLLNGKDKS